MRATSARLATAVVVAIVALAASAAPAAGQKETRNGLCGAKNMMNPNAAPHMSEAMAEHTHENGNRGMGRAVALTAC